MSRLKLAEADRKWLRLKWARIRASQQRADRAGTEWTRLNDALNEMLDRSGEYDIVQRDKVKGMNLTLKGHLSTHKWHAEESQRHIDDVNLFLRMKELEVL